MMKGFVSKNIGMSVGKFISQLFVTLELCLAILIPLICFNWTQGKVSTSENRVLAGFPKLFQEDGKLSSTLWHDIEVWFEDNLGLRDAFLNLSSFMNYKLFNRSTSEKVELGKDGWLYYTGDYNLDLARGTYPGLDEDSLKALCGQQEAIKDRLAAQGIEYILVIAPSKASIYPEYIASGDYAVRETASDIFADYLNEHSDVKVIQLKDALLEAKENADKPLFFKNDTHWSWQGRYIGYREIVSDLYELGLTEVKPKEVASWTQVQSKGDLSNMMGAVGLGGKYLEESYDVYQIADTSAHLVNEGDEYNYMLKLANAEQIPADHCALWKNDYASMRAAIYCDSMIFGCIAPQLAEHFYETAYFWSRELDQEMIDFLNPDVVICEVAERQITRYIKEFGADYLK